MSKLREHLTEMINNPINSPQDLSKEIEGTFEDILFQLESISEMDMLNFNVKKKLNKSIVDLRKLGFEISKNIKGGK